MKHLLTGVAVVAALALSAPVGAQQANPSGGNSMGMPGPSPGGPGLTPYSTGAPPPAAAPTGRMPTGGKKLSGSNYVPSPAPTYDTTSATPPTHRHPRPHHPSHGYGHMAHGPKSLTDTTAQLNQAELARLQQGAPPTAPMQPPAPPPPYNRSGGNSMGMPGPNAGGPGLTPYSGGGAPQR
jgi:hypothetical protein